MSDVVILTADNFEIANAYALYGGMIYLENYNKILINI